MASSSSSSLSQNAMRFRVEIVYASYDDHSGCYFYGIRVIDTETNNRELTSTITRRRFREFIQLHYDLDKEIELSPELSLPSKFFRTSADRRRPLLERYLNELLRSSLATTSPKAPKLPRSLQKFLGLADDAFTAIPIDQMTFEEYDRMMLSRRDPMEIKDELAKKILAFTIVTAGTLQVVRNVLTLEQTALVMLLQIMSCAYAIFIVWPLKDTQRRRRLFQEQCAKLKSKSLSSLGIDVNAPLTEDASIPKDEAENIPKLRQRLVDFVQSPADDEPLGSYDEAFVTQYGKTIEGLLTNGALGEEGHKQLMKNLRKDRIDVWNNNVAMDHRLTVFLRYNGNSLDRAESQARFALTVRAALRMDFIHDDYRPPEKLFRYSASPMLTALSQRPLEQRDERLAKWWLRDREGGLCTFVRMGEIPTGTMFEIGLNKNADVMNRALIWFVEMFRLDMDYVHLESKGRIPAQCTVVADMAGFDMSTQLATADVLSIVKKYVPLISPCYGGLLKRYIVINAPWYVNMLLNIVKPFIPKDILDSVRIHRGYDKKQMLDPFIEDKYVPKYLGGSLVGENGDEFCRDRVPPFGPFESDKGMSILKAAE